MKKIFSILAIAAAMVACSKDDATTDTATDVAPATYTLTGYSSLDTRTDFGEPNNETKKIPFLWSEGDKILVLNEGSGTATEGEISYGAGTSSATFSLTTASENGNTVYYNLNVKKVGSFGIITADAAATANVPAEQSTAKNLGQNGDFGYAEVADGAFTLNHATAYLWFDVKSLPEGYTLQSISFDAGETKVAGEAKWNGSAFGEITNGSSVIDLVVDNDATMVAMVVLPATIESATITYRLSNGTETKYQTKTLSGRTIESGKTYKISADLAESEPEYELRVLTFEDEDAKEIEAYHYYSDWMTGDCTIEEFPVSCWSDFIPKDSQYGGGHGTYSWWDKGNTELAFTPSPDNFYGMSGHAGISNYVGKELLPDTEEWMYDLQAYNVSGGANGSSNFNSQFGYLDPEEYATEYSPTGTLPGIYFGDGIARIIDHMYVTNTTYAYQVLISGECDFGGTYEYTDLSTFRIVAYGYDSMDDSEPTIAEFYLLNTNKRMVTEWTKWDLSVLGSVVRIEFNLVACDNGYGIYGNLIPAYFAYDDVAVRFYDDEK